MKKYWEFKDPEDYVRRQFDNIPGLKDVGGYDFLKRMAYGQSMGRLTLQQARLLIKTAMRLNLSMASHIRRTQMAR